MTTAFDYIAATGVIVPDTSNVLTDVQSEWVGALGANINLDPATQQGVLITGEVTARTGVVNANAKVANQINPNLAGGLFLDALCALMGLYRAKATATQVINVTLTGVINTNIPSGTRASLGQNGPVFTLQNGVTLANDGSGGGIGFATFVAVVAGPQACASGALNTPVDSILGWETITNNQSGSPASVTTLGTNQQTDASLRALRNNTLALQGISTVQAQISGLYALNGVTSVAYRENVGSSTAVIDGITLVGHSVWACVDGGASLDIATSLLKNKTDGAAWNGAQDIPVVEPASGQTYQVLFDRPTYVFIYGAMSIKQGSFIGNLQSAAAQAVADYFVGAVDGFQAVGIGQTVSPFEIAAAVVSACPGCIVMNCTIGTVPGTLNPADIAIALNQRAITNNTAFTITVS
jgi:uncharacterized phage protein gp47/JayE